LLREENRVEIGGELPHAAVAGPRIEIIARCRHAVAVHWCRSSTHEVIVLVSGEDEQCIALIDTVASQPSKKLAPSAVISPELRNVTVFAWTKSELYGRIGT